VRDRIRELSESAEERARVNPQLAMRRALTSFVHGCALLGYGGEGASAVVAAYRAVLSQLADPAQRHTGSALELASLACVDRLRDPLAEVVADPEPDAGRDDEIAGPVLRRVPAELLGDLGGAHYDMACFNAAGSCLDGVVSPYQGAGLIVAVGYYEDPPDDDLLTLMRELRTRYEDDPDNRGVTADEITGGLRAWLDANRS